MKPARRLEDLQERLKSSAAMLSRAAAELGAWPAKAAAMVEAALVNASAQHAAAAESDRERIRQLGIEYLVLERERDSLKVRVSGLQHSLTRSLDDWREAEVTLKSADAVIATAAVLDAEFTRRVKVLEASRAEIEALVGAVRDRMRRREQEQADAALNRAAIAAAVPGLRR